MEQLHVLHVQVDIQALQVQMQWMTVINQFQQERVQQQLEHQVMQLQIAKMDTIMQQRVMFISDQVVHVQNVEQDKHQTQDIQHVYIL